MAEAMTEFYEVKQVEGKGLGCVALRDIKKGTTILKETPQMRISSGPSQLWEFIREVSEAFNKMNKNDQKEYLNLHDKYADLSSLPLELKSEAEKFCQFAFEMSKKLQIIARYEMMLGILTLPISSKMASL